MVMRDLTGPQRERELEKKNWLTGIKSSVF